MSSDEERGQRRRRRRRDYDYDDDDDDDILDRRRIGKSTGKNPTAATPKIEGAHVPPQEREETELDCVETAGCVPRPRDDGDPRRSYSQ